MEVECDFYLLHIKNNVEEKKINLFSEHTLELLKRHSVSHTVLNVSKDFNVAEVEAWQEFKSYVSYCHYLTAHFSSTFTSSQGWF